MPTSFNEELAMRAAPPTEAMRDQDAADFDEEFGDGSLTLGEKLFLISLVALNAVWVGAIVYAVVWAVRHA